MTSLSDSDDSVKVSGAERTVSCAGRSLSMEAPQRSDHDLSLVKSAPSSPNSALREPIFLGAQASLRESATFNLNRTQKGSGAVKAAGHSSLSLALLYPEEVERALEVSSDRMLPQIED
eukprot:1031111-Rhodomonas_salina.1